MEKYESGSHRRPHIVLSFCNKSEKHSMSHKARGTNTDESRRERRHASSRACRRQSFFFLAAPARKLSLSAFLARAEGVLKCHPRHSEGGAAIEVLSVSSVFWVYPWVHPWVYPWVYPWVLVLFG